MGINTKTVAGRRQLKFTSLDDVLADAERCLTQGYRPIGNWSAGQIFAHIAKVMNGSIDGLPFTVPWPIRMLLKLMRNKFITGPMTPGFQLPSSATVLIADPLVSPEQGLNDLRQAVHRLKSTTHRAASPAFGVMTREDSDRLQINHAAMHLSFLVPPASAS